jgi:sialidase-1
VASRLAAADGAGADPRRVSVFTAGQDGYHSFRIPSILVTPKGTLLAFAEGRKRSRSDSGDIDLVLRRSSDGGATWTPLRVLWDDGPNTCGNPCPVADRSTGTVWLLLTHNLGEDDEAEIVNAKGKGTRGVWVSRSDDDGETWSQPREVTKDVKKPEWTWYATGPGVGIQTRDGRLVVPCDSKDLGGKKGFSFVVTSDDHGASWKLSGIVGDLWNECQVAELADGALLLNMRNHDRTKRQRGVATSRDGGRTWSPAVPDSVLIEPVCQASLLRFTLASSEQGKDRLLFSNPASTTARVQLNVRLSYDEGKTWPVAKELHAGPAAYSCLAVLPDGTIGCLFEAGEKHAYERIEIARFSLEWLSDGRDRWKG